MHRFLAFPFMIFGLVAQPAMAQETLSLADALRGNHIHGVTFDPRDSQRVWPAPNDRIHL